MQMVKPFHIPSSASFASGHADRCQVLQHYGLLVTHAYWLCAFPGKYIFNSFAFCAVDIQKGPILWPSWP